MSLAEISSGSHGLGVERHAECRRPLVYSLLKLPTPAARRETPSDNRTSPAPGCEPARGLHVECHEIAFRQYRMCFPGYTGSTMDWCHGASSTCAVVLVPCVFKVTGKTVNTSVTLDVSGCSGSLQD